LAFANMSFFSEISAMIESPFTSNKNYEAPRHESVSDS
jgi:hypothetical protein